MKIINLNHSLFRFKIFLKFRISYLYNKYYATKSNIKIFKKKYKLILFYKFFIKCVII